MVYDRIEASSSEKFQGGLHLTVSEVWSFHVAGPSWTRLIRHLSTVQALLLLLRPCYKVQQSNDCTSISHATLTKISSMLETCDFKRCFLQWKESSRASRSAQLVLLVIGAGHARMPALIIAVMPGVGRRGLVPVPTQ